MHTHSISGGPKQQKRYRRLMMHRIKWEEDLIKYNDADEEVPNSCKLVWEGKVQKRSFGEIRVKSFKKEQEARDYFKNQRCEHYWDLAYSGAVLEMTSEM